MPATVTEAPPEPYVLAGRLLTRVADADAILPSREPAVRTGFLLGLEFARVTAALDAAPAGWAGEVHADNGERLRDWGRRRGLRLAIEPHDDGVYATCRVLGPAV